MDTALLRILETEASLFFQKLGVSRDVRVSLRQDGTVSVEVTMEEPQMFIGEKGQTLGELQHILKRVLRKKAGEPIECALDINEYRKSKEQYLKELTLGVIAEVSLLRKPKELPPMSPAERRLVHMIVAEREDVESESVGEGEERRVVVKAKNIL